MMNSVMYYEEPKNYTVTYSICIAFSIIVMYYFWAFFIFRYGIDRIGNLILVKYGAINNKQLDKSGSNYFNYANVVLSNDKKSATCDMQLRDKTTQDIQSSKRVTYALTTDPASCTLLDALNNCVVI